MVAVEVPFSEILKKLGAKLGSRGRASCPVHQGNNATSFSFSEEKGLFHCFACGARGDKVSLVMKALGVSFRDALRWLGIDVSNRDRWLDRIRIEPDVAQERQLLSGLDAWANAESKRRRKQFRDRGQIECYALERLRCNPDDELGWRLLEIAYAGTAWLEYLLDLLDGNRADKLLAFQLLEDRQ